MSETKRFIVSLEMIVSTIDVVKANTLYVLDTITEGLLSHEHLNPDFKRLYIKELEGEA